MGHQLTGKKILVVQGSLLSGSELVDALTGCGAKVYLTANLISAFDLLRRIKFDGAVIDQGLHNVAFDLCSELHDLAIPYICCTAPHQMQRRAVRQREADHAAWRLSEIISARAEIPQGFGTSAVAANRSATTC